MAVNNKVIKYRRKPKAAAMIFAVVIIYIICFIAMYLSKSKVRTYEVETGTLTANASFNGVILRSENVYNTDTPGYVNYYKREGTRVKTGDTLYTVDETGKISSALEKDAQDGKNSLSDSSLASIKSTLNNFKTSYDGSNFSQIYDVKTDINSTVLEAVNESIMANIQSTIQSQGTDNTFKVISAPECGIVVYNVDGYEGKTVDNDLSDALFKKSDYNKNNLKADKTVGAGDPVYKIITNENWNIVVKFTQDDVEAYGLADKKSVKIKIKKDNVVTTADFSLVKKDDGYFGVLGLNKYMIRYANERFLDIEIISSGNSGLKVPTSAITEKEFYTIPKEYMTKGGNSNNYGFLCEKYDEHNNLIQQFVSADIYKVTDDTCYVDKGAFTDGASIIKTDSNDRYVVGTVAKLKGVYCVNTGYTVFKIADIIEQNDEYSILKRGVSYGVSAYDRIVLDADKYQDNQMIY